MSKTITTPLKYQSTEPLTNSNSSASKYVKTAKRISCFSIPTNEEEIQGVCVLILSGQSAIKAMAIKTHSEL